MNRVRLLVWSAVALLALAVGAGAFHPDAPPTVNSIKDQHEDCGSGGEDYRALKFCLVERYGWPAALARRFGDAMRERHLREGAIGPTDWDAFRHAAADLRAVYRALGVRDREEIEAEIEADSETTAFSDSLDQVIRDSVEQAWRRRQHAL